MLQLQFGAKRNQVHFLIQRSTDTILLNLVRHTVSILDFSVGTAEKEESLLESRESFLLRATSLPI